MPMPRSESSLALNYSAFDTTGEYEFLLGNTVLYLNKSYIYQL